MTTGAWIVFVVVAAIMGAAGGISAYALAIARAQFEQERIWQERWRQIGLREAIIKRRIEELKQTILKGEHNGKKKEDWRG